MIKSYRTALLRCCATALFVAAGAAHAQYAWIDEKGVHQFSDHPPPPSTPASKILKAPGKPTMAELLKPEPAPAPETQPKAETKPTLADREADFRKRSQEAAKQQQKAEAETQQKKAQAQACDNARRYKQMLESGVRIADADANGERAFISDDERQKRMATANATLASCN
jgi:hypothetical protein